MPVKPTLEIATFELPVLVTVMFRDAELPTVTLPKLTLEGLMERLKPGAIPVPLSATEGVLDASLASERVPVEDPALVGSNCTLNVLVWPAFSVSGRLNPEALKPAPVTLAAVTVTLPVPGLPI